MIDESGEIDVEIRQSLGRQFGWLWTAYTISTLGTWLGFGAFPMLAILVLHASAAKVSVLEAAGLTVGAIVSVPLGHWVEFRRKRKVMIGMDLIRFLAFMSVPLTYALAWLSYAQLLIVAILVAASNVAFVAASGANLKTLIRPDGLIIANSRFESTLWMAALFGPPLGGFAIGLFGPVITIVVNALSFLCSALGIVAIGGKEPQPEQVDKTHLRLGNF
jgi:MFS family permease